MRYLKNIIIRCIKFLENLLHRSSLKKHALYPQLTGHNPLLSVVVPTYNTPEPLFRQMVESVIGQIYDNLELVIIDDASPDGQIRKLIKEYAKQDKRIKYKFLDENQGISGATNEAIKISSGEFVSLFDHDDVLSHDALYEVAKAINEGDYDFVYTNEDKITGKRNKRHQPYYKPAWNKDFLYSANYITHFTTIRKKVLDRVGYEDSKYDGAQDWELFLRCTRTIPSEKIYHIPKMLYSWRVHELSTAKDLNVKPYIFKAQKAALEDNLRAAGHKNFEVLQDQRYPAQWQVKFKVSGNPRVDIFILKSRATNQIIQEINDRTQYNNYKIHVIDGDFSSSIDKITGEYVVYIQDKLAITDREWIKDLLGDAQRSDIGFVQARLKTRKDVLRNISHILDNDSFKLIKYLSRLNGSKHLYMTSRYNIHTVHEGVVMVEAKKLRKSLRLPQEYVGISQLSAEVFQEGYRNLYNPYVKVLK